MPVAGAIGLLVCGLVLRGAGNPRAASSSAGHAHAIAARGAVPDPALVTGDACMACHNGLSAPTGEDVSIGRAWRASMMANSARDPYWQAAVRREVLDHPAHAAEIQNECARCHMPMAHVRAHGRGRLLDVLNELPRLARSTGAPGRSDEYERGLAADGVSCTLCHQISAAGLGTHESFTGGFVLGLPTPSGDRPLLGPFEADAGRRTIMRSSSGFTPERAEHVQRSELCATCHTLYTEARGPDGAIAGRLPEQMPYLEWRHSAYRESRSCQSCHMPEVSAPTPVTSVLGEPRDGLSRHGFLGGNAFVLRMLARYRDALGVRALPMELEAAASATERQLRDDTASLTLDAAPERDGRLSFEVLVENRTGHKLPTGYPSRRAWLHVIVRDARHRLVFESGALEPTGAIIGNDADEDAGRFEPHHTEIARADQVQVYESTMVDVAGRVTTGLLSGVRFVKDNRLLPRGFDAATASPDIAIHGAASIDTDFRGGSDRVRYLVEVANAPRPILIEAELLYQPIAYRWARNLGGYDAPEPRRFVGYFESMASTSATRLANATLLVK
jgi:hypothetical protein